ncbi:MAG: HAMP domain-containing histidine kinase [Alphaproteobacteria bacterium]|nr:HAMP domain-containing histidine kinase [Alphaproteobacteria bacterium]MBV9692961.1 HAMP domain-containing histidine kinase [Alphaproteobacteria bacterium]
MINAQMQERAAKLELDQLSLALKNLGPNHFLMPVFAAITCVMFHRWVDTGRLVAWFLLLCLGVLPLGFVSERFRRREPTVDEAAMWLRRTTLAFLLFAASWASMAAFLWVPHNDFNNLVIVLLLACTIAGNSALVGSSRPLALCVFAVYGSALIATPLRTGGLIFNGIAGLAAFYVGYLAYMAMQINRTARDMLMLRNDKSDLILALAHAKTESDVARERAEAASRAKSQFLANMSHELRTPLNAILGFSELIAARAANPEKHCEYAALIHGSGQHLLMLINDVLDLAKIEAGSLELRESEIDLARLLDDCVDLMRARASHAEVHLAVDARRPLAVWADERALKQIVLNLLSNAVKYTPAGGAVRAFADQSEDGVRFGVADNGVGIAPEDHVRVFQSFGQGRHDVATSDKGTGLGLPIAQGLAQAHGGTIALESSLGAGTRVSVTLPAARLRTLRKAS